MRRPPWKLIGLAGLAGVAATGAVVARNRRAHRQYDPDELRERLHRRLAEATGETGGTAAAPTSSEDRPAGSDTPSDGATRPADAGVEPSP